MTFHGAPRADRHTMEHVHESPPVMTVPLIVLAVGALFIGMLVSQRSARRALAGVLGQFHRGDLATHRAGRTSRRFRNGSTLAPLVFGLAGIARHICSTCSRPRIPARARARSRRAVPVPAEQVVFRRAVRRHHRAPALRSARILWQVGDGKIIDGSPNGVATLTPTGPRRRSSCRPARSRVYAFAMLIGWCAGQHLPGLLR